MAAWTADELDRIGRATEVAVASRRADGEPKLTSPATTRS